MRKTIIFFLLVVCAVAMLCSCNKAKNITASDDNVFFAINGGEKSINVSADGSWEIQDCPDWVKAEAEESQLTITVEKNTTGAVRDCVINLVGHGVSVPITITQADKCTHIALSETDVHFPKEGGTKELSVDTDGDRIAIQTADGFNADIKDDKLIINAPQNQNSKITSQIVLRCDTVKTIVNVVVEGAFCGRCNGTGEITCPKCRGRGGEDAETSDGTWVGCSRCGGYGDYWPDDLGSSYGHPGSGRITCPTCGGSGQ